MRRIRAPAWRWRCYACWRFARQRRPSRRRRPPRPAAQRAPRHVRRRRCHGRSPLETKPPVTAATKISEPPATRIPLSPERWNEIVIGLGLGGLMRELASHTVLESESGGTLSIVLHESCAKLHNKEREAEFKRALETYEGRPFKLSLRVGQSRRAKHRRRKRRAHATNVRRRARDPERPGRRHIAGEAQRRFGNGATRRDGQLQGREEG